MGIVYDHIVEPGPNIRIKVGHIEKHSDWVLCNLEGYLDNQNTPSFLKATRVLLAPGTRVIGFDLSELSYISSTGVGALSALTLESKQTGRFFFVSGVPDRIDKVLKLLGFGDLFVNIADPAQHDFSKDLK